MLLPPRLAHFVQWFADFQTALDDTVRSIVAPADDDIGQPVALPAPSAASEPGAPADAQSPDVSSRIELQWAQWLDDIARPELVALREHVRRGRERLVQDGPLDHALRSVVEAVAELPEQVDLLGTSGGPDLSFVGGARNPVDAPLREFLQHAFLPEVEKAFVRLRAATEEALVDTAWRIDGTEKVLEYYSLSVQRHAVEVEDPEQVEALAHTGHERVRALLDELRARRLSVARRIMAELIEHTAGALEDACAPYRSHRPDDLRRKLEELERAREAGPPSPGIVVRARAAVQQAYGTARPFGRRLATELRALLAERESDGTRRAYETLLAADAAELGRDLPPGYRQLFGGGSIEFSDTYVPRRSAEAALENAIAGWQDGAPQAVLLYGDRGSGKRTLLNQVLAREIGRARTGWVRLGPRLRDEAVVARALARRLNVRVETPRFAALAKARASTEVRRVMVIENADRILSPTSDGIQRMSEFLRLVGETASSTLWILLMATPAADLALYRLDLAHRIPTIVRVDPMSAAEIRAVVMRRHRLSGFQLEFAQPNMRLIDHVRDPIGTLRATRHPNDAFFARLWALAGGNPRQALYYWLASARPHPRKDGNIFIDALPSNSDLLPSIGLSQRLILALLAQYGSLADAELRSILAATIEGTEGDLQVLCARRLVAASREHERHFTLQPTAAHPLVMELRAANMI
jgi:hypothetical protein